MGGENLRLGAWFIAIVVRCIDSEFELCTGARGTRRARGKVPETVVIAPRLDLRWCGYGIATLFGLLRRRDVLSRYDLVDKARSVFAVADRFAADLRRYIVGAIFDEGVDALGYIGIYIVV